MVLELFRTVKSMLNSMADIQIRLEEFEALEEMIHTNTKRIEHLERKIIEGDTKKGDTT